MIGPPSLPATPRTFKDVELVWREVARNPSLAEDPVWRLQNLYVVKDKDGRIVPFEPNPEQLRIIRAVYEEGVKKILIIKARQLGMSTVIEEILADRLFFIPGQTMAIVDQTQSDASKKLKNKVKIAWDHLPQVFRSSFAVETDNDSQFTLRLKNPAFQGQVNDIQAGMTARGDTFQAIHISEWGPIQAEDAARSEKIFTGAIPAAKNGIVIVETTWKGGKHGHLWELAKAALETPEAHKTKEDFHVFFFPWWTDAQYETEGDFSQIPEDVHAYFDGLEEHPDVVELNGGAPYKFSPSQRLWYYKRAIPMGIYRFQEFPSILEEAFTGSTEGVIYHEEILRARLDGRVLNFSHSRSDLVHTFWDLGAPHNTVTWYAQFIGREIHIIDCDFDLDLTITERIGRMLAKPYSYGSHFVPHDATRAQYSGPSFVDELSRLLSPRSIRVVPRTNDVWTGINHVKQLFSRIVFNKADTHEALDLLDNYRSKVDAKTSYVSETIVHDDSSHVADALRMLAEADLSGMLGTNLVDPSSVNPMTGQSRAKRRRALMS